MLNLYPFNVRVYGLLLNEKQEILVSDEQEYGKRFSKFPGGGLEYGEGLKDGLKREFREECAVEIEVLDHIYTTDFYEPSYFNNSQIISIYYRVNNIGPLNLGFKDTVFDFGEVAVEAVVQAFRWVNLHQFDAAQLTFRTDQLALQELKEKYRR